MDRVWGPEPDQRNEFRIETPRLVLDVPEPADAPALYTLVGGADRDEVCATLLWEGPDDVTEIEAWIVRCRTATFEPFGLHWVLRDRTGDLTGTAGTAIGAAGTRSARLAPDVERVAERAFSGHPEFGGGPIAAAFVSHAARPGFRTVAARVGDAVVGFGYGMWSFTGS